MMHMLKLVKPLEDGDESKIIKSISDEDISDTGYLPQNELM